MVIQLDHHLRGKKCMLKENNFMLTKKTIFHVSEQIDDLKMFMKQHRSSYKHVLAP